MLSGLEQHCHSGLPALFSLLARRQREHRAAPNIQHRELARSSRYFRFVAVAIFSKWVPVQRKRWFTLKLSRTWNVRTLHSQT